MVRLAAGSPGVVGGLPQCPENKKKANIKREATGYCKDARDNRMPFEAARGKIDHGAD